MRLAGNPLDGFRLSEHHGGVGLRLLLPLLAIGVLCAGCNAGKPSSADAQEQTSSSGGLAQGFATARSQLGGMQCASIGLLGGAAIGHYTVYTCAGPDHAGIGVPTGAYVCWGFHDFGLGRQQPAVELNLMDRNGHTIGGHLYDSQTTSSCRQTLKAVIGLI